ncbi:MAG: phytoene desaturase family protein [Acidobacteriota bacterium]|nr:phytoene desaturase family protein [Acidobacteriota bacterium]
MKKVIIIGAGLGGLAAAIRLAALGFSVTILEKNESVGGKVNFIESGGYKFDTGASLLTMRHVLKDLFEVANRRLEDYLELVLLEPICRYFWSDGTVFDASRNLPKTLKEIEKIEPRGIAGFEKFMTDARRKYEVAERTFLAHSLNDLPKLLRPRYAKDLAAISSWKTLNAHNRKYFRSLKLQQLFNRFATYNGSSPYQTPATFALIPFVEFGLGAWYVRGGIYEIPKALTRVATELGVEIKIGCEAEKVLCTNHRAVGIKLKNGEEIRADFVVSNADAIETYRDLIEEKDRPSFLNKRLEKIEPSCSGFVLLLGAKKQFPQLAHHNIFFSDDYPAEFNSIFKEKRPAVNPTIYVCAVSRTDPTQAPTGCENLFVLINAPYTSEQTNWEKEKKPYRDLIIKKLEDFGLKNLENSIEYEQIITPADFEEKYRANRGSIYGVSSNGVFAAFLRPPNQSKDVRNLFFVGGATHPGGGMPLVMLSGKMAADLIQREIKD